MRERRSWDWDAWGRKAETLHRRRSWKEALACFNQALRRNPLDTASRDAYLSDLAGKVDCLVRLGRFRDAARCVEELKKHRPKKRGRKSGTQTKGRAVRRIAELDWAAYLGNEGRERPSDLFGAVIEHLWAKMGQLASSLRRNSDTERARNNRRLKSLVSEAKTISEVGKRALLEDRDFWEVATRVPSMGGEIEEIRSGTRACLERYVRKYGAGRFRS